MDIGAFRSSNFDISFLKIDYQSLKPFIEEMKARLSSPEPLTFDYSSQSQRFQAEYLAKLLLEFLLGNDCQGTDFSPQNKTRDRRVSSLPKLKYLAEESPKDKVWDTHRATADIVACLYKSADYERYHERISNCSTLLEFVEVVDNQTTAYKLRSAFFCRHRYCTVCQWRNSLMWTARLLKAMPKIQKDYPTHRYILLTLTVRNCHIKELKSTVEWMNKAWDRFVKRKAYPGVGFIKGLEVTRNEKDGTAHPHFHVLISVKSSYFGSSGGYLSKDKWIKLWKSCLRVDYDPSIDIQVVNEKKHKNGLVGALKEVVKYTVKPSDLINDAEWLAELTEQMFKMRTRSTGGIFKKYITDDDPKDYITENPDEEVVLASDERLRFDWDSYKKKYMRKDNSD